MDAFQFHQNESTTRLVSAVEWQHIDCRSVCTRQSANSEHSVGVAFAEACIYSQLQSENGLNDFRNDWSDDCRQKPTLIYWAPNWTLLSFARSNLPHSSSSICRWVHVVSSVLILNDDVCRCALRITIYLAFGMRQMKNDTDIEYRLKNKGYSRRLTWQPKPHILWSNKYTRRRCG